jgi:hypothetical protein
MNFINIKNMVFRNGARSVKNNMSKSGEIKTKTMIIKWVESGIERIKSVVNKKPLIGFKKIQKKQEKWLGENKI